MNFDFAQLIRPDLVGLTGYSSARSEYTGSAATFLDANENPFPGSYNRYPDPLQLELKARIAQLYNVSPGSIFLSNGSDELIDLLMRATCIPGKDKVVSIAPSYGMYAVSARINNVTLEEVTLGPGFSLPVSQLIEAARGARITFICSPNNPTGNAFSQEELVELLRNINGLVVIDEAYVDFSAIPSMLQFLDSFPNLVISQTFSKAYGLAGIRLGKAFASTEIVNFLNLIKPPYNISTESQRIALNALENREQFETQKQLILAERERILTTLKSRKSVLQVFPSDANFILFRVENATELYDFLKYKQIIVRNRSTQVNCENTLRVSIGTPEENTAFLQALTNYERINQNT